MAALSLTLIKHCGPKQLYIITDWENLTLDLKQPE